VVRHPISNSQSHHRVSGNGESDRRIKAKCFFCLTNPLTAGVIHAQRFHRHPTLSRQALDLIAFELEVLRPKLEVWVKQSCQFASLRINGCGPPGFMQVASWTGQSEILQQGASTFGLGNNMFDVKCSPLEKFVHPAILAASTSTRPNRARQFFRHTHQGCLPRICSASPRTSDNCSLNSTNASSSSRSDSGNRPSLLRSISSCKRWSALAGKCRLPTASTHSTGAAIVEFTTLAYGAGAQLSMSAAKNPALAPPGSALTLVTRVRW
jgi:hypothetical protein